MLVTPLPIVTLVRLEQNSKADSPMLVTLLPIVTPDRLVQFKNESSPRLVTGRPSIMLGMITAPPGPMYLMIVIVLLLVVQIQGTCGSHGAVGRPPNVGPQPVVPDK